MKLSHAISQLKKIRTDLLFDEDFDRQDDPDETTGDILFLKGLAQLEVAIRDLELCRRQYIDERK